MHRPWCLLVFSLFVGAVCHAESAATLMIETVLPGVVTVAAEKTAGASAAFGAAGASPSAIAYDKVLDLSDAEVTGSGFVIAQNGKLYVVTNAHVIQTAVGDTVFAYSLDRSKYKLELVGADTFYDIAVLAFADPPPGKEIHPLSFRASEPALGETVYAIGNPLGAYPYTVTSGIVGGKNRIFPGFTGRFGFVQSSAPTSWGNSGGPLIDANGAVLGINTRIEIKPRAGQLFIHSQLNFALQSSYAARLVSDILNNHGRVRRAYLGICAGQFIRLHGERLESAGPAVLARITPGSPAAEKLADYVGWRIDAVNGREVRDIDDLLFAFEQLKPLERVTLQLSTDRGARPVRVELQASELTPDNLVQQALSYLESEFHLKLHEQGDSLVAEMDAGPSGRGLAEISGLVLTEDQEGRMTPHRVEMPPVIPIVGAGLLSGDLLFHTRNLRDLAVAVRLVAPAAELDLFLPSKQERQIAMVAARLHNGETIRRSALY